MYDGIYRSDSSHESENGVPVSTATADMYVWACVLSVMHICIYSIYRSASGYFSRTCGRHSCDSCESCDFLSFLAVKFKVQLLKTVSCVLKPREVMMFPSSLPRLFFVLRG